MDLIVGLDDELIKEFVNESREHLTTIEADLLAIEEGGSEIDVELVNKVFRAAHSIKGASGFFGLTKVKELAHKAETILDMVRSKKMTPNAEITNLLLAAFDQLREMVNHIEESADADISELMTSLTGLMSSYLPQEQKLALTETVNLGRDDASPICVSRFDYERVQESGLCLYSAEYDLIHDIERQGRTVLDVFRILSASGEILDCDVSFEAVGTLDDDIGKQLPLRLILATAIGPDDISSLFPHNRDKVKLLSRPAATVAKPAEGELRPALATIASPAPVSDFTPAEPPPASCAQAEPSAPINVAAKAFPASAPPPAAVVEDSIRVSVGTLDMLMNLAGELVLGRNQLRASIGQNNPRALKTAEQRINQITSELQDAVMQTRLQPMGNVFGKFPRLVRDVAAALGKDIQLDIRGKDVALDRTLIESLSDPLTHMVRNAVDHGIESQENRARAGKPRQGSITIDARHEAGQVVVEISDDGGGIDPDRIAKVALSKGLLTAEQIEAMSAKDKTALIFLPGLSTTKQVTDLSGRGVGMDVVKTNLDRLGGKVEIISTLGQGTTFRIKLPLTLAIIPSLIVSVDGERFAIPQINVEEMLRVTPGQAKTRIEIVGDAEVLVLRERLIPLVRFAELLGVTPTSTDAQTAQSELDRRIHMANGRSARFAAPENGASKAPFTEIPLTNNPTAAPQKNSALEVVVVTTGTQRYGLVVSGFHDTEEIVVKPLGAHLKGLEEYAGATILGDGSVALILDIAGLAGKANLDAVTRVTRARERAKEVEESAGEDLSFVLFHNSADVLCGVPLDAVSRIEQITRKQVETIGGRRTMQYHGGLLPLVTLSDAAQVEPIGDDMKLAVMIANVHGHEVGLLAAMPVDVVDTKTRIDETTHRQNGVAGSTIIRDRTALIVDLCGLVDARWPEWAALQVSETPQAAGELETTVLLAEDSDFFRAQVTRFLKEDGHNVLAAPDGEAAWELLLQNLDKVRAVVTDVEMPRLDGLGLARRIRADRRTAHLPIIALTSLAGEDDIERGNAAGINDYQTKVDRDRLSERVKEYLNMGIPRTPAAPENFAAI
jgi:two-component system chemotaxis sensor kinase CheA